jgi:hypothetical protein
MGRTSVGGAETIKNKKDKEWRGRLIDTHTAEDRPCSHRALPSMCPIGQAL